MTIKSRVIWFLFAFSCFVSRTAATRKGDGDGSFHGDSWSSSGELVAIDAGHSALVSTVSPGVHPLSLSRGRRSSSFSGLLSNWSKKTYLAIPLYFRLPIMEFIIFLGLIILALGIILHFVELKADYFEFRREHLADEERQLEEKALEMYYERQHHLKYHHNSNRNNRGNNRGNTRERRPMSNARRRPYRRLRPGAHRRPPPAPYQRQGAPWPPVYPRRELSSSPSRGQQVMQAMQTMPVAKPDQPADYYYSYPPAPPRPTYALRPPPVVVKEQMSMALGRIPVMDESYLRQRHKPQGSTNLAVSHYASEVHGSMRDNSRLLDRRVSLVAQRPSATPQTHLSHPWMTSGALGHGPSLGQRPGLARQEQLGQEQVAYAASRREPPMPRAPWPRRTGPLARLRNPNRSPFLM